MISLKKFCVTALLFSQEIAKNRKQIYTTFVIRRPKE
jgi:hypothetical protein